jgi:hypothetical protein
MTINALAAAKLRSDLLDWMYRTFPSPLKSFDNDTKDQLRLLQLAGLVRPISGGFTLTEAGRRDRQQAQRFQLKDSTPPPPPEAA